MRRLAFILALIAASSAAAQKARIASEFEIAKMEELARTASDFRSQLTAHLNLGELRSARNESALATREFRTALRAAQEERDDARAKSDLARYVTASAYAGLASGMLHDAAHAFEYTEEAARYDATDASTWNVIAIAMSHVSLDRKAAAAAKNAVSLASAEAQRNPSSRSLLDLGIYRNTLANALEGLHDYAEGIALLESTVASLRSKSFDRTRKEVAKNESFEVYWTARGEAAAYVALLNHAQLKLAELYEETHQLGKAREVYAHVLADRSDDPVALEALGRLAGGKEERAQLLAGALDANPFSIDAVREYDRYLSKGGTPGVSTTAGTGAEVRRALEQMNAGENLAARATLDSLAPRYPGNDVVQYLSAVVDINLGDPERARARSIHVDDLRRDIADRLDVDEAPAPEWLTSGAAAAEPTAAELRSLLALLTSDKIAPAQRSALDKIVLTNDAAFDPTSGEAPPDQAFFLQGRVAGVPFTFGEAKAFRGAFHAADKLRLVYRILGATQRAGVPLLLLEPVKLELVR